MRHAMISRLLHGATLLGILCLAVLLLALTSCIQSAHAKGNGDKWVDLFNGKNLDGWMVQIKVLS